VLRNGLWWLRAVLDLLVGGVGPRRRHRDAEALRVGDTVDFWRVEVLEPGRRLRLVADSVSPGDSTGTRSTWCTS
jgi:hypothetical protein